MAWYWDSKSVAAVNITGPEAAAVNAEILLAANDPVPGFQRWYGPYASQAAAQAAGATLPVFNSNPGAGFVDPLSGLASSAQGWVVRIAEIVAGVVILAIGLNALLRQSTGVDVGYQARRAGRKAAVFIK